MSRDLRSSPGGRFVVGFAAGGAVTFVGFILYSCGESAGSAATKALAGGIFFGIAAGIVSVFGKKWLTFVLEFLTRFGI